MAYTAKFNFIGDLIIPKDQEKFVKKWKGGQNKDRNMAKINFGVKESESNACFVDLFEMVRDTIYSMNTDNEKIEIPWSDRLDADIVKSVASYKKYVVELGNDFGGRKEFLSGYDFILYLEDNLPNYEGKVNVKGRYTKSLYQGKLYDNYEIDSIYATTSGKNSLKVTIDIFYNKDCVDDTDFKSEKKIYLNGYARQYIDKDNGEKFLPQNVVLNASKFTDSEDHQKILKHLLKNILVKKKDVIHIPWECKVIRGSETVEFDESMLSDAQKEQIDLGLADIKDFMTGDVFGPPTNEIRLVKPVLKGDFVDGVVDSGLTMRELEDELYVSKSVEKMEDVIEDSKDDEADFDEALADLMG